MVPDDLNDPMPFLLCPVSNEDGTARNQDHANPIRQRKPLSQEQYGKDCHEDNAELVYRSNATAPPIFKARK
jgi:hypothetical protein